MNVPCIGDMNIPLGLFIGTYFMGARLSGTIVRVNVLSFSFWLYEYIPLFIWLRFHGLGGSVFYANPPPSIFVGGRVLSYHAGWLCGWLGPSAFLSLRVLLSQGSYLLCTFVCKRCAYRFSVYPSSCRADPCCRPDAYGLFRCHSCSDVGSIPYLSRCALVRVRVSGVPLESSDTR